MLHKSAEYGGMTLQDYYAYLVDMHNEQYSAKCMEQNDSMGLMFWSPVITLEKDVLMFVRRIHHFSSL